MTRAHCESKHSSGLFCRKKPGHEGTHKHWTLKGVVVVWSDNEEKDEQPITE